MFELIDFLIVNPIINILLVIYNFIGDFGVAMILFTVLVKFLSWPLVKKQFLQAKLMRKIQPELTEIRKHCNGNKQLEAIHLLQSGHFLFSFRFSSLFSLQFELWLPQP